MRYGYTRVSSAEQASPNKCSLADQDRVIRGVAMMRGAEEPTMFSDPDISGTIPLADRPDGARLLTVIKKGDELIIAKLDRAFRSASDALNSAERMQAQGISLILADMGPDPVNNGNGVSKFFFTILAGVAEFEKGRILERMQDGRRGKKARGGHIGGSAPYGFQVTGAGHSAILAEVPDEQRTIALARDLRDKGESFRDVSSQLANVYGRTARNGKPFSAEQVRRILSG